MRGSFEDADKDAPQPLAAGRHTDADLPLKEIDIVARHLRERQARARFLPGVGFGEPAWEMLLELYIAQVRGRPVSVSGLCYSSGVPPTTALRRVHDLETKRMISKVNDRNDGRRIFVRLTRVGIDAIERWARAQLERQDRFEASSRLAPDCPDK